MISSLQPVGLRVFIYDIKSTACWCSRFYMVVSRSVVHVALHTITDKVVCQTKSAIFLVKKQYMNDT